MASVRPRQEIAPYTCSEFLTFSCFFFQELERKKLLFRCELWAHDENPGKIQFLRIFKYFCIKTIHYATYVTKLLFNRKHRMFTKIGINFAWVHECLHIFLVCKRYIFLPKNFNYVPYYSTGERGGLRLWFQVPFTIPSAHRVIEANRIPTFSRPCARFLFPSVDLRTRIE